LCVCVCVCVCVCACVRLHAELSMVNLGTVQHLPNFVSLYITTDRRLCVLLGRNWLNIYGIRECSKQALWREIKRAFVACSYFANFAHQSYGVWNNYKIRKSARFVTAWTYVS